MCAEYERLYTEFLTKSIKTEKEKMELTLKLKKANRISAICVNMQEDCSQCVSVKQWRQYRRDRKGLAKRMAVIIGAMMLFVIIVYALL